MYYFKLSFNDDIVSGSDKEYYLNLIDESSTIICQLFSITFNSTQLSRLTNDINLYFIYNSESQIILIRFGETGEYQLLSTSVINICSCSSLSNAVFKKVWLSHERIKLCA